MAWPMSLSSLGLGMCLGERGEFSDYPIKALTEHPKDPEACSDRDPCAFEWIWNLLMAN